MKRIPILLTALLVFGCGSDDDPTGSSGDELSQAQVDFIADQVLGAAFAGLSAPPSSPQLLAGVPVNVSISYDQNCPVFGRLGVSGGITGNIDDNGSGALFLDVNITWTDCTYSDTNGDDFVINGDPFMSMTGTFSFLNGFPATQQTLQIGGGFRWDNAGGSGGCNVNLTFNFATATSGTTSVSGTLCGRSVNRTL